MTTGLLTDSYSKESFDPSFDRQIDLILLVGLAQFQFLQTTILIPVRQIKRPAYLSTKLNEFEKMSFILATNSIILLTLVSASLTLM